MGNVINYVVEEFEKMSLEDKEFLLEILKKQIIENKRERLLERTKEALENYEKGLVNKGNISDLLSDLEND